VGFLNEYIPVKAENAPITMSLSQGRSPTCPHSHEVRPMVGISEMAPTRNHKGRLST